MRLFSSWYKYIILVVVILAVVGAGIYFLKSKPEQKTITPTVTVSLTPTPTPFMLTIWTDAAGFSFQYPKELSVNNHEEDNDNYAHVELTNPDHPGKLIVWVSDLPQGVTTLDSWVAKLYQGATTLDTKLGGEPAKKIMATAPVKTLSVGTISDNLLFNVEGTLTDSEYWQRVHETVVGNFAFTDTSPAATVNTGSGGGGSADETEVIN